MSVTRRMNTSKQKVESTFTLTESLTTKPIFAEWLSLLEILDHAAVTSGPKCVCNIFFFKAKDLQSVPFEAQGKDNTLSEFD